MFFRVYIEPIHYHLEPGHFLSIKLKRYKRSISDQLCVWVQQYNLREDLPIIEPLRLDLWFFRTRPKTIRSMYPDKRPDRDNLEKPAIDGLKKAGIVHDDDCIVSGPIEKRWAGLNYPDCGIQPAGIVYMLSPMPKLDKKRLNSEYRQLQGITPLLDRDAMRSDREADMRDFLVSGLSGSFDFKTIEDYIV